MPRLVDPGHRPAADNRLDVILAESSGRGASRAAASLSCGFGVRPSAYRERRGRPSLQASSARGRFRLSAVARDGPRAGALARPSAGCRQGRVSRCPGGVSSRCSFFHQHINGEAVEEFNGEAVEGRSSQSEKHPNSAGPRDEILHVPFRLVFGSWLKKSTSSGFCFPEVIGSTGFKDSGSPTALRFPRRYHRPPAKVAGRAA